MPINTNYSVQKESGALIFHKSPELQELKKLRNDVKELRQENQELNTKLDEINTKLDEILSLLKGGTTEDGKEMD